MYKHVFLFKQRLHYNMLLFRYVKMRFFDAMYYKKIKANYMYNWI